MLTHAGAFVSAFGSGALCYWTVQLKNSFSFDDALDAFGIHGTRFTCFTGTKAQILTRREALLEPAAIWGTHFTCFTGTKVQILTRREALLEPAAIWGGMTVGFLWTYLTFFFLFFRACCDLGGYDCGLFREERRRWGERLF
jgi:hypothetical protein